MVFGFRTLWRRGALLALVGLLIVLGLGGSAQALPDLIITVGDTTGNSGELNSAITVYLDNFKDTIAAFELWLQLDRPDLMIFQTDTQTVIDTTFWKCVSGAYPNCTKEVATDTLVAGGRREIDTVLATIGNIDTAHTLISGWDLVTTRSVSGTKFDIKVSGLADDLAKPGTKMGIRPQQGGVLFRLRGDILDVDPALLDRTVRIKPNAEVVRRLFSFSRPDGTAIGINSIIAPDTDFFRCTAWVPPHPPSTTCLQWLEVGGQPADSISIRLDTTGVLDTNKVWLYTGSLTVNGGYVCGNMDGELPANVDIADLTYLISYLYLGGQAPVPFVVGNCDCDPEGGVDISDLSALIDHLYITLLPLCCQ